MTPIISSLYVLFIDFLAHPALNCKLSPVRPTSAWHCLESLHSLCRLCSLHAAQNTEIRIPTIKDCHQFLAISLNTYTKARRPALKRDKSSLQYNKKFRLKNHPQPNKSCRLHI